MFHKSIKYLIAPLSLSATNNSRFLTMKQKPGKNLLQDFHAGGLAGLKLTFRPNRCLNLSDMRFLEYEHAQAALADTTAY